MQRTQRTVLIIDDDPADRLTYRRSLAKDSIYHYPVLETEHGKQALALCHTSRPDCLILTDDHPAIAPPFALPDRAQDHDKLRSHCPNQAAPSRQRREPFSFYDESTIASSRRGPVSLSEQRVG